MSHYLKAFQSLSDADKAGIELFGENLLIEELKDEEFKTKSGLVLATAVNARQINGLDADKPTFVRVLQVGAGYYDDDTGEAVTLDVQPGDIGLVGKTSIKKFSVFGRLVNYGETTLGLIRESDIQMRFKGQEAFDRYFDALNRALEIKMGSQSEGRT